MGLDCVLLAAGLSSRMKTWKMLLPYKSSTVVQASVRNALSVCSRVILVTGFRGSELAELFRHERRVLPVYNETYASGMFSSVRCGVACVESRDFFFSLGDMPAIAPETYRVLFGQKYCDAAIPLYGGSKGHPVFFRGPAKDAILRADEHTTLRDVLSTLSVTTVSVDDPGILYDIDTENDYEQEQRPT